MTTTLTRALVTSYVNWATAGRSNPLVYVLGRRRTIGKIIQSSKTVLAMAKHDGSGQWACITERRSNDGDNSNFGTYMSIIAVVTVIRWVVKITESCQSTRCNFIYFPLYYCCR